MTGSAPPTRRSRQVVVVRRFLPPIVAALLALTACAPSAQRALGSATPSPFPSFTPSPGQSATATPTPTPTANPQCPSPPSGGGGGGNDQGGGGGTGGDLSGPDAPPRIEPAALGGKVKTVPVDKSKPTVTLCFAFSSDRTQANGREQVTFTPDLKVCKLIFRLWPNKPVAGSTGTKLTLTKATVAQKDIKPTLSAAGAASGMPGTLATLKLPACVKAGTTLSINLEFTLDLVDATNERVGHDDAADVAWAGTAYPLLAWVPGKGWATEPAVMLYGEMATSTVYDLSQLLVVTNSGDTVMGAGTAGKVEHGPSGTETHSFSASSVRDVAVAVGSFAQVETVVDGITVHLAIPSAGAKATSQQWMSAIAQGMRALTAELGTFPYPEVWLSVLPDIDGGIEYPGSVLYGDAPPDELLPLVTHELAHQWFYGLVGNDQAASPWLDEGFATYASAVALGDEKDYTTFSIPASVRNKVGESMSWYSALKSPDLYTAGVYQQGAKMLLEARAAAGPAKFTALTKAYIKADANKIATPAAVKKAYASSPAAVKVMQKYGAFN